MRSNWTLLASTAILSALCDFRTNTHPASSGTARSSIVTSAPS